MPQGIQSAIHYNKPILTQGHDTVNHLSVVDLVGAAAHDAAIRLVVDNPGKLRIAQHAAAEQARLSGAPTYTLEESRTRLEAIYQRG